MNKKDSAICLARSLRKSFGGANTIASFGFHQGDYSFTYALQLHRYFIFDKLEELTGWWWWRDPRIKTYHID